MTIRWDKIDIEGQEVRCYVGVPDHAQRRAGVIVAHHGPGLDEGMYDVVHRLTRAGFACAMPDLYHRIPASAEGNKRSRLVRDEQFVTDMNAALGHLKSLSPKIGPIGVTGFCMGGRIAYLMAGANRELKGAAVFFGGGIMEQRGSRSPFERTAEINCPVIGFFGSQDTNPSPADVAKIDAELTRLGKWHEFHTYQDTGHAFLNFLSAERYRHRAAESAWPSLIAFFKEYLV